MCPIAFTTRGWYRRVPTSKHNNGGSSTASTLTVGPRLKGTTLNTSSDWAHTVPKRQRQLYPCIHNVQIWV